MPRVGKDHQGFQRIVHRQLFFREEATYPVQIQERIEFKWVHPESDEKDGFMTEEIDINMQ